MKVMLFHNNNVVDKTSLFKNKQETLLLNRVGETLDKMFNKSYQQHKNEKLISQEVNNIKHIPDKFFGNRTRLKLASMFKDWLPGTPIIDVLLHNINDVDVGVATTETKQMAKNFTKENINVLIELTEKQLFEMKKLKQEVDNTNQYSWEKHTNYKSTLFDLENQLQDLLFFKKVTMHTLTNIKIDNISGWGAVSNNKNIDYLGLRVQMQPKVFLNLAAPLHISNKNIEQHIKNGGTIASPFLKITIPEQWLNNNFTEPAVVVQHEGRNRMLAIQETEGNVFIEVHLFFTNMLHEHLTDKIITELNQKLKVENNNSIVQGPLFKL